jgi:hypothetical protein
LPIAGTSNAQASKARHRSRASASEPEEKKLTDVSFTRSTKARIASSDAATTGVLDVKSNQARAINRGLPLKAKAEIVRPEQLSGR